VFSLLTPPVGSQPYRTSTASKYCVAASVFELPVDHTVATERFVLGPADAYVVTFDGSHISTTIACT
jgi:hypothetical protein